MAGIELIGLSYSPWTEKAKWALDHHGVSYRYREHLIFFGEPKLRWKMRRFVDGPTVPALIEGSTRLSDSYEIARYADRIGRGARLFPEGDEKRIAEVNRVVEDGMDAGRAVMLAKLARNPDALFEGLPSYLRARALVPLARFGAWTIARDFKATRKESREHATTLCSSVFRARELLKGGGGRYVTGQFSFGDIALCTLLQFVEPVADDFIAIGPATRAAWRTPELAAEFKDLTEWRDKIYRDYRRVTGK